MVECASQRTPAALAEWRTRVALALACSPRRCDRQVDRGSHAHTGAWHAMKSSNELIWSITKDGPSESGFDRHLARMPPSLSEWGPLLPDWQRSGTPITRSRSALLSSNYSRPDWRRGDGLPWLAIGARARAVAGEPSHLSHRPVRRVRLQESAQERLARYGAFLLVVYAPELLQLSSPRSQRDRSRQRGRGRDKVGAGRRVPAAWPPGVRGGRRTAWYAGSGPGGGVGLGGAMMRS